MARIGYRAAAQLLAERDPVLARLVAEAGLPTVPVAHETHFATLVRSIVYQQLATAAARAIHGRLIAALGSSHTTGTAGADGTAVTPERVLATPPETLRAAGLSGRKVESLRDLATKVLDGTVILDPRKLARLTDEEITARLVTVRGIGKWSADIFLMFRLRRMDVWPTGDLAVRRGFGLAWAIPEPTERQLIPLGEPYRPYRSVVAWYCWQAVRLHGKQAPAGTGSAAGVV